MSPRKLKNPETVAWGWFSKWIRLRDADDQGYVACYTCDIVKPWKELQAGHFVPQGSASILKYEPDNVRPQCVQCNMYLSANLMEYTLRLIDELGIERVEWLRGQKHKTIKRHELEYPAMIEQFKADAKHEAQERGIKL